LENTAKSVMSVGLQAYVSSSFYLLCSSKLTPKTTRQAIERRIHVMAGARLTTFGADLHLVFVPKLLALVETFMALSLWVLKNVTPTFRLHRQDNTNR
jgi:hypothetical protein